MNKPKVLAPALVIYSLIASYLFASAIHHDDIIDNISVFGGPSGIPAPKVGNTALFILVVYLIRVAVLLGPSFVNHRHKIDRWVKGGLVGSVFPEVICVAVAINLLFEKTADCGTGTDFSNCGWGVALIGLLIVVSCVAQIIGMIVGKFTTHSPAPAKAKK